MRINVRHVARDGSDVFEAYQGDTVIMNVAVDACVIVGTQTAAACMEVLLNSFIRQNPEICAEIQKGK